MLIKLNVRYNYKNNPNFDIKIKYIKLHVSVYFIFIYKLDYFSNYTVLFIKFRFYL